MDQMRSNITIPNDLENDALNAEPIASVFKTEV